MEKKVFLFLVTLFLLSSCAFGNQSSVEKPDTFLKPISIQQSGWENVDATEVCLQISWDEELSDLYLETLQQIKSVLTASGISVQSSGCELSLSFELTGAANFNRYTRTTFYSGGSSSDNVTCVESIDVNGVITLSDNNQKQLVHPTSSSKWFYPESSNECLSNVPDEDWIGVSDKLIIRGLTELFGPQIAINTDKLQYLLEIPNDDVVNSLLYFALNDKDESKRANAIAYLCIFQPNNRETIQGLEYAYYNDRDNKVRGYAAISLGCLSADSNHFIPIFTDSLNDKDIRAYAALALGYYQEDAEPAAAKLISLVENEKTGGWERQVFLLTLARIAPSSKEVVDLLIKYAQEQGSIKSIANSALDEIGSYAINFYPDKFNPLKIKNNFEQDIKILLTDGQLNTEYLGFIPPRKYEEISAGQTAIIYFYGRNADHRISIVYCKNTCDEFDVEFAEVSEELQTIEIPSRP